MVKMKARKKGQDRVEMFRDMVNHKDKRFKKHPNSFLDEWDN